MCPFFPVRWNASGKTQYPGDMKQIRIKELIIDNFKSFGKRTAIPFLDGFTTISGPNGSGKSNILDSILFALGLSTAKTLRAERLPDLIHHGSKRQEAQVTIRFAITDPSTESPTDRLTEETLEISRQIRSNRSGYYSVYYLNHQVSSLADIHEYLSRFNISTEGHNIVMQGDVTRITTMSAVERRKIIDDLAGVREFDRRIEQAREELVTAGQYMEQSEILLQEITAQKQKLGLEREMALQYQHLKKEKEHLHCTLLAKRVAQLRRQAAALVRDRDQIRKERDKQEGELVTIRKTIYEVTERLQQLREQVEAREEQERVATMRLVEALKGKLGGEEKFLAHITGERMRQEQRKEETEEKIRQHQTQLQSLEVELEKLIQEKIARQMSLEECNQRLQAIYQEIGTINEQFSDLSQRATTLRNLLVAEREQEKELTIQQQVLRNSLAQLAGEIEGAEKRLRDEEKNLEVLQNQHKEKSRIRDILRYRLQEIEQLVTKKKQTYEAIKQEHERLEVNYRGFYKQYTELKAREKAMAEVQFGGAIKAVLQSGIAGIHGPVSQLAKVPPEYEVALEVAAGVRLNYIVVEDDGVGEAVIDFLKRQEAGRVTLLPLNKIRASDHFPPINSAGIIDYAINLVQFDPLYRRIFAYVFGDTLVVQNLSVGRSLLGQYRMVTLEGELLEKSGAMTGGSLHRRNRQFGSTDLKEKQQLLEKAERRLQTLQSQLRKEEEELSRLLARYAGQEKEVTEITLTLENIEQGVTEKGEVLSTVREGWIQLQEKQEILERELRRLEERLLSARETLRKREEELTQIENLLAHAELMALSEKSAAIEQQKREAEKALREILDQYNRKELEKSLINNTLGEWKTHLTEITARIRELEEEIHQRRHTIQSLDTQRSDLEAQFSVLDLEWKKLRDQRNALQQELDQWKQTEYEKERTIDRLENQLKVLQQKEEEITVQIEEITREYPDFDFANPEYQTDLSLAALTALIRQKEEEMVRLEPINMRAIAEFELISQRHTDLEKKIAVLLEEREAILKRIEEYESLKQQSFLRVFNHVNESFQQIYQEIAAGAGELLLDDPENPLAGGLTIRAQPRNKPLERMEAMSGGEKSLTALAFLFALQSYQPVSFYILDEVDMFLDGFNTQTLARMIRRQAAHNQFIVVSLRKTMIEASHQTIGVVQNRAGYSQVTGVQMHP